MQLLGLSLAVSTVLVLSTAGARAQVIRQPEYSTNGCNSTGTASSGGAHVIRLPDYPANPATNAVLQHASWLTSGNNVAGPTSKFAAQLTTDYVADEEDKEFDEDEDVADDEEVDEEDADADEDDEDEDEDDDDDDDEEDCEDSDDSDDYPPGCIPLGEPFQLDDCLSPCSPVTVGGWFSAGYHSDNTRQSFAPNDLMAYNDLPDRLNLHQSWFYVEKDASGSSCSADYGFRADIVYGTDAQSLQATGTPRAATMRNAGRWDASFDHGSYGWAIPQAYGEVAYGDWSIKGGYFLSLIGYETSLAPDNFFYSHSLTMFNSEPFTHTGLVAEYAGIDGVTFYSGWTLGWDTAWEQSLGGSNFLGGFSVDLSDHAWFTYMTSIGDFGYRGEDGYNHTVVLELELNSCLEYALQSDYVRHNDSNGTPGLFTEQYGIVQYLYYTLNENLALGGRAEWWKSNTLTGIAQSYYEITGGINITPHANLVIRPEIRYDWTPAEDNVVAARGTSYNNTVFAIDCVFTY
jgi:hypothetical protein